jgi:hypothetical protein
MVEILKCLNADFNIPNNKKEIIKKLDSENYDNKHKNIKNYVYNYLFNNNNNDNDSESINKIFYSNNDKLIPENLSDINTSSPIVLQVMVKEHYNNNNQLGGKKVIDSSSDSSSDSKFIGSRKLYNPYIEGGSKKSQEIHTEIINMIKNMGYSEEDANDIKNHLYYEVKDKYPKLNNTEKAEKMLELVKNKVSNINMDEIRKELQKYRERRDKLKSGNQEVKKEKKEKKETKATKEKKSKK